MIFWGSSPEVPRASQVPLSDTKPPRMNGSLLGTNDVMFPNPSSARGIRTRPSSAQRSPGLHLAMLGGVVNEVSGITLFLV